MAFPFWGLLNNPHFSMINGLQFDIFQISFECLSLSFLKIAVFLFHTSSSPGIWKPAIFIHLASGTTFGQRLQRGQCPIGHGVIFVRPSVYKYIRPSPLPETLKGLQRTSDSPQKPQKSLRGGRTEIIAIENLCCLFDIKQACGQDYCELHKKVYFSRIVVRGPD